MNIFSSTNSKKAESKSPVASDRTVSPIRSYGSHNLVGNTPKEASVKDSTITSRSAYITYDQLNDNNRNLPPNIQELIAAEVKAQITQFKSDFTDFFNENQRTNNEKILKNTHEIDEIKLNLSRQSLINESKLSIQSGSTQLNEENRNQIEIQLKNLDNRQKELSNYMLKMKEDLNRNVNVALNEVARKISYDNEMKLREIAEGILHTWEEKLNNYIIKSHDELKTNKIIEKHIHVNEDDAEKLDEIALLDSRVTDIHQYFKSELDMIKKILEVNVTENANLANRGSTNERSLLDSQYKNIQSIKNEVNYLHTQMDEKLKELETRLVEEIDNVKKLIEFKDHNEDKNQIPLNQYNLDTIGANLMTIMNNQKNLELELIKTKKDIELLNNRVNNSNSTPEYTPPLLQNNSLIKEYEKKTIIPGSVIKTSVEINKWTEIAKDDDTNNLQNAFNHSFQANDYSITNCEPEDTITYNNPQRLPDLSNEPAYMSKREEPYVINSLYQNQVSQAAFDSSYDSKVPVFGSELTSSEYILPPQNFPCNYAKNDDSKLKQNVIDYSRINPIGYDTNRIIMQSSPPKADYLIQNTYYPDPTKNYLDDSNKLNKFGNSGNNKLVNSGKKQENEDDVITTKMVPAKINFRENMMAGADFKKNSKTDDEELSLVYQLDASGYLMDDEGNYMKDDYGNKVKLSENQLEQLRAHNILDESN